MRRLRGIVDSCRTGYKYLYHVTHIAMSMPQQQPRGIINVSHVSCHLTCAIQLLIHGMGPLCEALVEIGRSKTQENSVVALLGTLIDEYHHHHHHTSNNSYQQHHQQQQPQPQQLNHGSTHDNAFDEVAEDPSSSPMDPSRFYKILKEKISIDPNDIGDAATAIRRILQAIRVELSSTSGSPALDELYNVLLRGTVRQSIVGRKGSSQQRTKAKDREMACPMSISGGFPSVELGLAHVTTHRQSIHGFDWNQVNASHNVESDLLTNGRHDGDDHLSLWETYKVTHFVSLPHYLLLHLERFSYSGEGKISPIRDTLDVPLAIDMSNYLCDSHTGSTSNQYSLRGAILHVLDHDDDDDNDEGGHYVSVHLVGDDIWYLVDDEIVSRIPSGVIVEFLSGRPCWTADPKRTYISVLLLYGRQDEGSLSELLDSLRTELAAQGQSKANSFIGQRLKVKWAKDKWYAGVVSGYDEATGKHSVLYDDGDVRHYNLQKKVIEWA